MSEREVVEERRRLPEKFFVQKEDCTNNRDTNNVEWLLLLLLKFVAGNLELCVRIIPRSRLLQIFAKRTEKQREREVPRKEREGEDK